MNAIFQTPAVESLLLSFLLKGQPKSCARAFGQVESAIWSCISHRDSAASIGRCIEAAIDPNTEGAKPPERPSLARLHCTLQDALACMRDPEPKLLLAYCDDVIRFAATVWQSWQDGYDAGWDDHDRVDSSELSDALDS